MVAVLSFDFKSVQTCVGVNSLFSTQSLELFMKLFHRCFHNKSKMWLPQGKSRNLRIRLGC